MIKIITEDDSVIHIINENMIECISYYQKDDTIVIHTGKYNSFRIKKSKNEKFFEMFFK